MHDAVVEKEFPYRIRTPLLVLALVWCGALASLCWAVIDVRPIRGRDGRVTVAPTSASIARWSVFGVCCLFGVLVSRWVWVDRAHRRRIALSPEGILVPRTRWYWFSVEEFIPYADIRDCRIMV